MLEDNFMQASVTNHPAVMASSEVDAVAVSSFRTGPVDATH